MTRARANNILGVDSGADLARIEHAYRNKFSRLHVRTVPGQPQHVREEAQNQLSELTDAWEFLKNNSSQMPARNIPKPINTNRTQFSPNFNCKTNPGHKRINILGVLPLPNRALAVSVVIVGFVALLVILLLVGRGAAVGSGKLANLRVLSVPWCNVEIDGRKIGSSGQAMPFALPEGHHRLVLYREGKKFEYALNLISERDTIVKVRFNTGEINVVRQ
jgi:hypothetical protein